MINRNKPRGTAAGIVLVLLVLAMLLAGCGGSKEEAQEPKKEGPVLLPSLTVKLNEEGAPTVLGIPPKTAVDSTAPGREHVQRSSRDSQATHGCRSATCGVCSSRRRPLHLRQRPAHALFGAGRSDASGRW